MKKLSPEDLDILKLSMIKSRIATQKKLSDIKKSAYKTKPPTNKRRANVETAPNVLTKSDVAKKQRIDTRLEKQDQNRISKQIRYLSTCLVFLLVVQRRVYYNIEKSF